MMSWLIEEAKPGTLSGRFGGEKRVEHLVPNRRHNSGAVVADPDFNTIAKVFGRGSEDLLVVAAAYLRSALSRCMEAV